MREKSVALMKGTVTIKRVSAGVYIHFLSQMNRHIFLYFLTVVARTEPYLPNDMLKIYTHHAILYNAIREGSGHNDLISSCWDVIGSLSPYVLASFVR